MKNSDTLLLSSDEELQAIRLICEAYNSVLKLHYENDVYEEPGAMHPQIALLRVLEQLPDPLAAHIRNMQLNGL